MFEIAWRHVRLNFVGAFYDFPHVVLNGWCSKYGRAYANLDFAQACWSWTIVQIHCQLLLVFPFWFLRFFAWHWRGWKALTTPRDNDETKRLQHHFQSSICLVLWCFLVWMCAFFFFLDRKLLWQRRVRCLSHGRTHPHLFTWSITSSTLPILRSFWQEGRRLSNRSALTLTGKFHSQWQRFI